VRAGPKDQSWDRAKATTTSGTKGRACAEVVGQSCGVVCVGGSGTVITTTDSHHQRAYCLPSEMILFTDHNGRVFGLGILEASTTDAASEKQPNIAKLK